MRPVRHLKLIVGARGKRVALHGGTPTAGGLPAPQGTPGAGGEAEPLEPVPSAGPIPLGSQPLKGDWLSGIRAGLREFEDARPLVEQRAPSARVEAGLASPGTILGRYVIQARLGEGSSAIVYRAVDGDLHRRVALKVLRDTARLSPVTLQRFKREAQVMASLTHPNIVTLFDAGEWKGTLYLAMEFVDGKPLSQVLRERRLGFRASACLLEKASRALGAAHAQGIIHRDLKPDNILITAKGEPKVGDFGLAHVSQLSAGLTRTQAALGTPLYMAPEQVAGKSRDVTPATDVYALGAILYEMIGGHPPHQGETLHEIYSKIVHEDPDLPRTLNPKIPSDLQIVALKALDKNPRRRYRSASEFADDLCRYMDGEAISARPVPPVVSWWRKAIAHRVLLAPALAVLVCGVSAGAWTATQAAARTRRHLEDATRSEKQGRLPEARTLFQTAAQEDPRNSEAMAGIVRIEAAIEKADLEAKSKELAEKAALVLLDAAGPELESVTLMAYDPRVTDETWMQKIGATRQQIEATIAKAPRLAPGHYRLGHLWELAGQYERAEEATRRAVALDPRFGAAHYQLGRLLLARAWRINLASEADPGTPHREAERLQGEGAAEIQCALKDTTGFHNPLHREVARGLLAYLSGDLMRARDIARAGRASYPKTLGSEEFYWLEALVAPRAPTIAFLTKALEARPKWLLVRWMRGRADTFHGNAYRAVADLDEVLRLSPEDTSAELLRAIAHLKTSGAQEALEGFDRVIARNPDLALAYCYRGEVRRRRKDATGALEDCTKAIELDERLTLSYLHRALAFIALKNQGAALSDLRRAIELDPRNTFAYLHRGRLRCERKEYREALADLTQAIDLDPRSIEALKMRSNVRQHLGDKSGAIADTARAAELEKH